MIAAICVALAVLLVPRRAVMTAEARGAVTVRTGVPPTGDDSTARWITLVSRVSRRRRRERDAVVEAVLNVLDVVAAALRAGQPPDTALRYAVAATPRGPWRLGSPAVDLVDELERLARVHGMPALEHVTRAWRLAAETGAPLANAVEVGAALMRHARDHEHALAVAFAGPRATIRLLSVLPLGGPVVGWVLGLDPVDMYLRSPLGRACLGVGIFLVVVGRVWCRRLLRQAMGTGVS